MSRFWLFDSELCLALVRTLGHFLWQGLAIALLATAAAGWLRRGSARARYLVYVSALLLMAACVPVTAVLLEMGSAEPVAGMPDQADLSGSPEPAPLVESPSEGRPSHARGGPRPAGGSAPVEPAAAPRPEAAVTSTLENARTPETATGSTAVGWDWRPLAPYVLAAYAAGVVLMLARLAAAFWGGYRLRRSLQPLEDQRLVALVQRESRELGLRTAPLVAYCRRIAMPVLLGVLKPTILLPTSAVTGLGPDQIEAILLHELAHVRRYDPLVNFLQRIIEAVLFFHPAVWYVSRQIRMEREHCCDDAVLAAGCKPVTYARSLLRLAELGLLGGAPGSTSPAASVAAVGDRPSQLRGRVLRFLGDREDARVRLTRNGALVFLGILLLGAALAVAAVRTSAVVDSSRAPAVAASEESAASDQAPKGSQADATSPPKEKPPGRQMLVRVMDDQGQPIAGASVRVWMLPKVEEAYNVGPDGEVAVARPEGESSGMGLSVRAGGYVPMVVRWRGAAQEEPIPPELTATLVKGITVGGVIRNTEGEPVEGATVHLSADSRVYSGVPGHVAAYGAAPTSDGQGRWQSSEMPPDFGRVVVRLEHPDYVSDGMGSTARAPSAEALRSQTGVMVMSTGLPIEGTVTDAEGSPIADALVCQGHSRFGTYFPTARTDGQGRYRFAHSKGGPVVLTVVARGFAPDLRRIHVRSGMEPADFRLEKGQTIRIRVIDQEGKPIPGVAVSTDTWRGYRTLTGVGIPRYTSEEGYWVWDWAPEDPIEYYIHKRGYMGIMDTPLVPRDEPHVLTMHPALEVSGRVVDAKTREPIEKFRVVQGMPAPSGEIWWSDHEAIEGKGGRYRFRFDFPRGVRLLRAEAHGYLPAVSRELKDDEGKVTCDFALHRGDRLSGVVRLPDGTPLEGAQVILQRRDGLVSLVNGRITDGKLTVAETDGDGRFALDPQTEPFFLVVLHDRGLARVTGEQLAASPEIEAEPWARLEGTLRRGTQLWVEQPLSLAIAQPDEPDGPHVNFDYRVRTDEKGRFVFDRVIAGKARLRHSIQTAGIYADYRPETSLGLSAGQTATLALGGKGRPVVGRLAVPAGYAERIRWDRVLGAVYVKLPGVSYPEELKGKGPEAYRAWYAQWQKSEAAQEFWKKGQALVGRERWFVAKADGSFRAENVEPGSYTLDVGVGERAIAGPTQFGEEFPSLSYEFTVPDVPGGVSDEPLDLGELRLEVEKPLEAQLAKPIAGLESFPEVSEGGVRDHVDLLRWTLKARQENREKIQSWQGRATIEEEGQRQSGKRYRQRQAVRFVFDRERNALRWNWRLEETTDARESSFPWSEFSAGMRTTEGFYRYPSGGILVSRPDARTLGIWARSQKRIEHYRGDFDPMWYLTYQGEDPGELLAFYVTEAENPALADYAVQRKGDLLTIEVARDEVVNRYTINLAQGGNLVSYFASEGPQRSQKTWDTRWTYAQSRGIWLPKTWTRITEGTRNDSVRKVTFVENVVNQPLGEEAFSIQSLGLWPGDWVHDNRTGQRHTYTEE